MQSNHQRKKQKAADRASSRGDSLGASAKDPLHDHANLSLSLGREDTDPGALLDNNRKRILALRAAIKELESRLGAKANRLPQIHDGGGRGQGQRGEGGAEEDLRLPPLADAQRDPEYVEAKPPPEVPTYATEYQSPRASY